jgi:hypothetical protein
MRRGCCEIAGAAACTSLSRSSLSRESRRTRYAPTVARPKTDDDATGKLRPEDETQRAKRGTRIGLLPKRDVLADFKKIARGAKR